MDGEVPALGDGRVNGGDGGAVDADAQATVRAGQSPACAGAPGGKEPVVAQLGEFGCGGRVGVRGDPGGLDAAVPGVPVHVGAGAGQRGERGQRHGGRSGQDQCGRGARRGLAYGPYRGGEQRPGDGVSGQQAAGVALVVACANGVEDDGGECGEEDRGDDRADTGRCAVHRCGGRTGRWLGGLTVWGGCVAHGRSGLPVAVGCSS